MHCLYCDYPITYKLANDHRKCAKCKRKFSLKKIKREKQLFSLFEAGISATGASKETGMHFATVQNHYERFRREIALTSDALYQQYSDRIDGYEEYLYLPKSLDPKKEIGKLQHFLTLSFDGKVYNLMMPSIQRLGLDTENAEERKLLEKYLKYHKIMKISKERSTIREFWEYFESFIVKFKGVSDERFVYYLKEAEWRFNARIH